MSEMMHSILRGMGQALDLGGVLAPRSSDVSPARADYEALRSDWQRVGSDMRQAMDSFGRDHDIPSSHGEERQS